MTTQEVKRKLTAILSADVKCYSRLMGEDEKQNVGTLKGYEDMKGNLIHWHWVWKHEVKKIANPVRVYKAQKRHTPFFLDFPLTFELKFGNLKS